MADKRELHKKRLRENLISSDTKVEVRKRRPVVYIFLTAVVLLCAVLGFWYYSHLTRTAGSFQEMWEKETEGSGAALTFKGYEPFCGGIITYTKDGAEYTDGNGNAVWQKSYQMSDPVCSVNGGFAVIIDRGGTTGCIFSEEQNTGNLSTVMPVSMARVSGKGVVYAVMNDDGADYISVFRKDGSALDITVKSVIDGDGYPFSIGVSPSGSQLITSYVAVGEGTVDTSVVFRNFGEVGQNQDSRRVVGGFIDEFAGHIVTSVGFSDEEHAHAFYDGGVAFFSTKVLNSPEMKGKAEFPEEMLSVASSASHVAVITENEDSENPRKLRIYDNNGELTGEAVFNLIYTGFSVNENNILIHSGDRILCFDLHGRLIADLSWDGKITYVSGTTRLREFIVCESGRTCRIKAE